MQLHAGAALRPLEAPSGCVSPGPVTVPTVHKGKLSPFGVSDPEPGSANHVSWAEFGHCLVLLSKFIHRCLAASVQAAVADLSCGRDHLAYKAGNIYFLALRREKFVGI